MAICEIAGCGKPADRVMAGGHYCADHSPADRDPAPPITPCSVCGHPAAGTKAGRALCREHLAAWPFPGNPGAAA